MMKHKPGKTQAPVKPKDMREVKMPAKPVKTKYSKPNQRQKM